MNKQAAEKIASEYYEAGIKLAHDKMASRMHKFFNSIIGGGAGLGTASAYGGQFRGALGDSSNYLKNIFAKGDAADALSQAVARLKELDAANYSSLIEGTGTKNLLDTGLFGGGITSRNQLISAIKASKAALGDGSMSALEKAVDVAPELALAGGIGTGVYKGLGKLDKKLKLY